MTYYAIIIAGGKGTRMKSKVPKQFLLLNGKPILMYSIENFFKAIPKIEITVVLPKNEIERWQKLCKKYSFNISHRIVPGGRTRFHSVKNGLKETEKSGIVAVHDGVRPLASVDLIKKCFRECQKQTNAVPYVQANESLRTFKGDSSHVLDRNSVALIQTPQCFLNSILKPAYELEFTGEFTDDATVVEMYARKFNHDKSLIHLIPGEKQNIKITSKEDLLIAEALLKKK